MPSAPICFFSGEPECVFWARPIIALQAVFPGIAQGPATHLFALFCAVELNDGRWKCLQCDAVFKDRGSAARLEAPAKHPLRLCPRPPISADGAGNGNSNGNARRILKHRRCKRAAATLPLLADEGLVADHLLDLAAA